MPSQYRYRTTIWNEYLGVSKVIRAMTSEELDWLIAAQEAKWDEQVARKRQQKQKEKERKATKREAENLKLQAEEESQAAQERVDAFRKILTGSLDVNMVIDWEQMLDRRAVPAFQFEHPKPNRDEIRLKILGPEPREQTIAAPLLEEPGFFEFLLPSLRRRRLEREDLVKDDFARAQERAQAQHKKRLQEYRAREKEAREAYNSAVCSYNAKLSAAKEKHDLKWQAFRGKQAGHNNAVLALRSRYQSGTPEAVEQYLEMAIERSSYPEGISGEPELRFDQPSKTLVISFWLPRPTDVPSVVERKYIAARKEIKPVEMKQKELEAFYDDVVHQIALRVVREVFAADTALSVEAVVFNGCVRGIDAKTGKPFANCILTYQASRKQFMDVNLAHVSAKECVRGFRGITAGPLAMLAPVRPIMELNRDDDRFVESKEILDHLRPEDNLAAMEWEDFEHLIRELFEQYFAKTGGEVRVTQASRDRGVDAIAFDPDPIRGGKIVIQAKRYNIVVPVSAVRDLYGTMISEGATKGILVTTSYFGHDSREFAKDKPIALIDGQNLMHMFKEHGFNVHISILPKGDPRRGLG